MKRNTPRERGQALVEYVLLTGMIVGMAGIFNRALPAILAKLEAPIRKDFRQVYRNGDPKACGYDDNIEPCSGTPDRHPRVNSRMFGRGK
jgi:hypothetical protein